MRALWIVVYINTESGELLPCYECGLHSSKELAEAQRSCRHDWHGGIPTEAVELIWPELKRGGYCWCDMCGFNAKLPARFRAGVADEHACPVCQEAGAASLLIVADQLPPDLAQDEPMMTWPATKAKGV